MLFTLCTAGPLLLALLLVQQHSAGPAPRHKRHGPSAR
ncbi:hypothetical protein J2S47_000124 [Streptomyces griseoviridis]|uniref:Uncharacterized protein n=1 Tax=Streptomyces griseoviridis TaxID=45398 RepID=A0ABT9L7D3_STRGD|nr:hypothetical protein [Streptomyces griseoviridis]